MKKLISVLLALCLALALCAFASAEASVFAGGSGTEDDPYQIATIEQFLAFAASVNDGSAQGYPGQVIALTTDIDAAGADWQPAGRMDLEDMSNYSCMFIGNPLDFQPSGGYVVLRAQVAVGAPHALVASDNDRAHRALLKSEIRHI